MPSNACWRSRSPSCTRTCTVTVSPGANAGTCLPAPRRASSSFSTLLIVLLRFYCVFTLELFQQLFLFRCQLQLRQQIGATQPRSSQLLLEPPAAYLLVVAGEQHLR